MSEAARTGRVLVTDDDPAVRMVVREALRRAGHEVEVAATLAEQARLLQRFHPQVLVTDVVLPDGDGLVAAAALAGERPDLPVIVFSAQNTLATALRANEGGAFDYLPKPFDLDDLTRAVDGALAGRGAETAAAKPEAGETLPLLGRSPRMQEVFRTIARLVAIDLTVLVLGESGTGKALVARAIHDFGPRRAAPFVAVDVASLPPERIEAELFGEGSARARPGRFGEAQGGTLFLDEIGDMPLEAQGRLTRVLQSGEYLPAGAAHPVRADVRIVAATHQDLRRRIAEGAFREDLYYRLDVVPVRLPPLRERREDAGELARHFLDRAAAEGLPRRTLDAAAVRRLERHDWPGNVRELENLMRRLAALGRDPVIGAALVEEALQAGPAPAPLVAPPTAEAELGAAFEQQIARYFASWGQATPPAGVYDRVLAELERPLLRLALAAVRGNQLKAASLLGLNRNTLRKKLTERNVGPPVRGGD